MSTIEEHDDQTLRDVQINLEISRGERPEVTIPLAEVEDKYVLDEWGNEIRFGDIYKDQKAIIVFVRHFLCFICKEYVDDLAVIPEAYLKEAGVKLVVIGCGLPKFIKPFRQTTGYKYDLYVDPERNIYSKLGLLGKMKVGKIKDSRHVKSGYITGVLKSTWRGMKFREFQGGVNQQGGAFICGPGDVLHFSHVDQNSTDHCLINDLLTNAGVHPVNYTKDSRVVTM